MATESVTLQIRGDTKAALLAANRVYAQREPIFALDTGELFIADGVTPFSGLKAIGVAGGSTGGGTTTPGTGTGGTVTVVDNGDGTATLTGDSSTVIDNGDGTFTVNASAVANGDGTVTFS